MAIADTSFAGYAQFQDEALRAGMDAVIATSLAQAVPVLRVLMGLYVLLTFALMAGQRITAYTFVGRCVRAIVVLGLITGQGFYAQHIRDNTFDTIPNAVASIINGGGTRISAAQQFDLVSQAAEAMVADVRSRNTAWSSAAISNGIGVWVAGAAINLVNAIIAGMWLLGRKLMAIVICFGVWLLVFELFDRTRGWVDHWIGAIVGLLVFQLGSSILLQVMLRGEMAMFRSLMTNPTANADEAVYNLFRVAGYIGTDALTMLALPIICAVGSGIGAAQGVGMALAAGVPGRAAAMAGRAAGTAGGALSRAHSRVRTRMRA